MLLWMTNRSIADMRVRPPSPLPAERSVRTLSEHESLTSIVEFAITLAGFAGIVVALGKRPGQWAPADRYRLLNILMLSFGAGFMAYLPIGLAHAGLSGSSLWRVSSGGFLCFGVFTGGFTIARTRRLRGEVRVLLNPIVLWMSIVFGGVANLAQLLNVLGLGFQPQFAPYFLGLVLILLMSAIQFVRILFARPE
jgi:hypothetical protein